MRSDGAVVPRDMSLLAGLQAENTTLRARVEWMQGILHGAIDHAIITLDINGLVTSLNPGARRLFGEEAELVGRPCDILSAPADRPPGALRDTLRRAIESGPVDIEHWHVRRDGVRFWASGTVTPLHDTTGGGACGFLCILRDRTDLREAAERRELLMAEMGHRTRNILSLVQAVAALCRRHAGDGADFLAMFDERLIALANAHDLLATTDGHDALLAEVIETALRPFAGEPDRIVIEGPPVVLEAATAVIVGLAVHELVTNAVKHGALSGSTGRVLVTSRLAEAAAGGIELTWRESGGPPVNPPTRRGFGTHLLERGMPAGGSARLEFLTDGLQYRLTLPLAAS